jgi:hypothetical protein
MAKAKTMQRGYRDVGYLIAVRVRAFRPAQFNARSWRERVACLGEHVIQGETEAIRVWFKTHYPALMHLIPERRQREFVAGFVERAEQEQQELIRLRVV